MKFATKLIRHYHLTLGMLLHYLVKLKVYISADIQQIGHLRLTRVGLRNYVLDGVKITHVKGHV